MSHKQNLFKFKAIYCFLSSNLNLAKQTLTGGINIEMDCLAGFCKVWVCVCEGKREREKKHLDGVPRCACIVLGVCLRMRVCVSECILREIIIISICKNPDLLGGKSPCISRTGRKAKARWMEHTDEAMRSRDTKWEGRILEREYGGERAKAS